MMGWKVHTSALLKEVLSNNETALLRIPLNILQSLLAEVAERAIKLKDPELDVLMIRLTLYSIADPTSPDYDAERVSKLLGESV